MRNLNRKNGFKLTYSEEQSELSQTSQMKFFANVINGHNPLIIFAKSSMLDVWLGSKCVSVLRSRFALTLLWRKTLLYRSQPIDLLCKSMDWFLYHKDLRHEGVQHNSKLLMHVHKTFRWRNERRTNVLLVEVATAVAL